MRSGGERPLPCHTALRPVVNRHLHWRFTSGDGSQLGQRVRLVHGHHRLVGKSPEGSRQPGVTRTFVWTSAMPGSGPGQSRRPCQR
jgi:hypothetical protein